MRFAAQPYLTKTKHFAILASLFLSALLTACSTPNMGGPVLPSAQTSATDVLTDVPKFEAMPGMAGNGSPLQTSPQ